MFLIAFAVRLAVALGTADLPVVRTPELDSAQYVAWAGWIAEGNHAWPQPTIQGPGYPYFLAVLLWLTGGSIAGAAVLQGVLGALSCVVTAMLATRWFGRSAGLAAGMLQALQGPLAYVETSIHCEGLLLFFVLVSVHVFTTRRSTIGGLVASGVLLGAAAIVRATALALVPVFAGILLMEAAGWRVRLRRVAAMAFGAALLILPVAAKNASEPIGSFQLQGFAGLNFYIGNSPAGSGTATVRLGTGWEMLWGEASRAGLVTPASQDRYYFRKTFSEIAGAPLRWLRILGSKAIWSIQDDEIRDSLSFHFFADAVPLLRWLPGFGLLVSLAAAGVLLLVIQRQRRRAPLELVWWTLAMWATVVLLVAGLRYRMPVVPPVAIFAGLGGVALFDALRGRRPHAGAQAPRWRAALPLAAAAIVAAVAAHVWRHAPSHALSEEWAMTGAALNSERRLTEAEAASRRALALDERSALAWKTLGTVLYNANRLEEARQAHRRALDIDPGFADAYLRLAFAESRLGHLDVAVGLLRKGAGILPDDVPLRRALGQHLFATRDYRGAVTELEFVLSRSHADDQVSSMLAEARRRIQ